MRIDQYAWNGKRDLFYLLGFNKNDSEFLKNEYEKQAVTEYCNGNYKLGKLDEYGQRITIEINFSKDNKNIVFTSGWLVQKNGKITNTTPFAG